MSKLDSFRKALEKKDKYNLGLSPVKDWISTGNAGLNNVISGDMNKGIAVGRVTALAGLQGCVDFETEFLTPHGWKPISEYDEGDLVAQFDKDSRSMSFVEPEEYIKIPCDEFYHIKSKYGVDQMLTPEHRVLYETSKGNLNVKSAEDVVKIHNSDGAVGFGGKFITTFNPPEREGMDISDSKLLLQVAVMADGYFMDKRKTWDNMVRINIKKKQKKDRLVGLLEDSQTQYKRVDRNDGFSVFEFGAPLHTKSYGKEFFDCSIHQLNLIADECLYWDGSYCTNDSGRRAFFSNDKKSADFIQYCFSATGRKARISEDIRDDRSNTSYIVTITDRNKLTISNPKRNSIELVTHGDGFKYCFSVPSTFLVLRRNGCIFVTGNSGKSFIVSNIIREAQQKGYFCIYIDTEFATSDGFMEQIGVDLDQDRFMAVNTAIIEDVTSFSSDLFKETDKEDKIILVIDSLSNLQPERDSAKFDDGKQAFNQGMREKALKQVITNLNTRCGDREMAVVFTSHMYVNGSDVYGNPILKPNVGEGTLFLPSTVIQLTKKELRDGKEIQGIHIKAKALKSRFTKMGSSCEFDVPWNTGMDFYDGAMDVLEESGTVTRNGAWYSYVDTSTGEVIKFQKKDFEKHADTLLALYGNDDIEEKDDLDSNLEMLNK